MYPYNVEIFTLENIHDFLYHDILLFSWYEQLVKTVFSIERTLFFLQSRETLGDIRMRIVQKFVHWMRSQIGKIRLSYFSQCIS